MAACLPGVMVSAAARSPPHDPRVVVPVPPMHTPPGGTSRRGVSFFPCVPQGTGTPRGLKGGVQLPTPKRTYQTTTPSSATTSVPPGTAPSLPPPLQPADLPSAAGAAADGLNLLDGSLDNKVDVLLEHLKDLKKQMAGGRSSSPVLSCTGSSANGTIGGSGGGAVASVAAGGSGGVVGAPGAGTAGGAPPPALGLRDRVKKHVI